MLWVVAVASAVHFTLGQGAGIIVPVDVGVGTLVPFLLDTGSTRTALSEELAARLSATAVGQTRMVTSSGSEPRPLVRVRRLQLGSLFVENLDAIVLPASRFDAHAVDGIIGQDVLARKNYTLDYRRLRVTWSEADGADDAMGVRLPLQRSDGRFLVELAQGLDGGDNAARDGHTVRFVPDSGASAVVVFAGPCGSTLPLDHIGRETLLTLSGEHAVDYARLKRFRVGSITLHDEPAIVIARTEPDEAGGDGLLPLHRFARVTFNVREGYLVLEPR